jgi:hypothetical protein
LTLDALRDFLADKVGRHEMPAALDIRAALPRTSVGKLSKKELIEEERRKNPRVLEPAASSPWGGGGGGGGAPPGGCGSKMPQSTTPTPDPSPQGGGEQKERSVVPLHGSTATTSRSP